MSHKTLFLQQSYEDCTRQYMEVLNTQKMPLWDYVILTASNESQAQSYRMQIQYRLEHGMLPKSIHYAVLPDPDGKRVGSGGATLNVLRYIYEDAGSLMISESLSFIQEEIASVCLSIQHVESCFHQFHVCFRTEEDLPCLMSL